MEVEIKPEDIREGDLIRVTHEYKAGPLSSTVQSNTDTLVKVTRITPDLPTKPGSVILWEGIALLLTTDGWHSKHRKQSDEFMLRNVAREGFTVLHTP